MEFNQRVWSLCRKVPKGNITTYKQIATAMKTKAYRAVGQALMRNPYAPNVPCHRVVSSNGSLGGFKGHKSGSSLKEKISLLKKEGVQVKNNKITDFEKRLFNFK